MKLLFFIFFIINHLHAETLTFNTDEGHRFYEIYSNEEQWLVDEFLAKPNELQDFVKRKTFAFEFEAHQYVQAQKKNLNLTKARINLVTQEPRPTILWVATENWNQDWENKYSQWIDANFDRDFFIKYNEDD